MIERGEVDEITGKAPELAGDEHEIDPDGWMWFWILLDRDLAGDRNENGLLPRVAVDRRLDELGIRTQENREVCHEMLRCLAAGRIDEQNEHYKKLRDER